MSNDTEIRSKNPHILSDNDFCNAANDLADHYRLAGMSENTTICNVNSAWLAVKIMRMVYEGALIPNPDYKDKHPAT